MKAKQLSNILHVLESRGDENTSFQKVTIDSRMANENTAFVAINGHTVDGHNYIDKAIKAGAKIVICESLPENEKSGVCFVKVDNTRKASGLISHELLDNPSRDMKMIGVTGTNGKTSVCTLLFQLFKSFGYKVGLISTVENKIDDQMIQATHTTPDPIQLAQLLADMRDHGCGYVFMEVSSHAIDQDRIAGVRFDVGAFTNITHDHLDYHGSFKNYITTKKKFFDDLDKDAIALVNADDKNGRIMLEGCSAIQKTYGLRGIVDYKCRVLHNGIDGLHLTINDREAFMLLSGSFNAYNLTCVYGIAQLLGEEEEEVLIKLSALHGAEGRMQKILGGSRVGIIDYAHTPDALENVLKTIVDLKIKESKLITVFGCGGDRDKAKRPIMGRIAAKYSDKVVVTSDNPRSENADLIIEEIMSDIDKGVKNKIVQIVDRKAAIRAAVMMSEVNDIILVAGKGHEKYQEIKGEKFPFEDKAVLTEVISEYR